MGRYKDYRERPTRGYDDEGLSARSEQRSRSQASSSRPHTSDAADAVVKWFNAEKGFGFVAVTNGEDAFLHIRQLEAAGHSGVTEGARLKVRLGDGQKGREVTEVIVVATPTGADQPGSCNRRIPLASSQQSGGAAPDEREALGTVRMYKTDKGFGFIGLDEGGKDAFVHASALEKDGLSSLKEGDRVRVKISQGHKGLEVRSIEIIS